MNCIFRWVHFSDLHYQNTKATFNTKELRKGAIDICKDIKKDFGRIDSLVLSGDYRFAPEKEENPQKVVEYIQSMAKSLGVEKSSIIAVPGNHDLNRNPMRDVLIEGIKKRYTPQEGNIDSQMLVSLIKDFVFFEKMHAELDDSAKWNTLNPHTVVELNTCNLLLLNTALTAGNDGDHENLLLGTSYVQERIEAIQNNKPIIAIGHHAFEELLPEERKTISRYFDKKGVRIYLCGHSHNQWFSTIGENIRQINVGCMMQSDNTVVASFSVGELIDDGSVDIKGYKWDASEQKWFLDNAFHRNYPPLYQLENESEDITEVKQVEKVYNPFSVIGYTLLGGMGIDGIKYIWEKKGKYVESLAFNKRLKNSTSNPDDEHTSAYTISTSIGCRLASTKQQCRFCETGTKEYLGDLKAEEIALQCIYMAEYDGDCPSYPQVRGNFREFAFMGQGEPGFNYTSIKQAILLTDYVMDRLGQNVSRYVISTSGVTDFIPMLIQDIKNEVFKNKVTVHFSLHAIDEERNSLMPINLEYDYKDFLKWCSLLKQVTGEKIGVGILMFDKYHTSDGKSFSLTGPKLERILNQLDNEVFRIDLCTVNKTSAGMQKHQLSADTARSLFNVVEKRGFEGKLFTSFGDTQQAGCGMLSSAIDDMQEVGQTSIIHFNKSVELLNEAKLYLFNNILK